MQIKEKSFLVAFFSTIWMQCKLMLIHIGIQSLFGIHEVYSKLKKVPFNQRTIMFIKLIEV